MSISTPIISWEAIISQVTPDSAPYQYSCKVTKVNVNDPGYGQLAVGYYIVDYIGHIFEIKSLNFGGDATAVVVLDLTGDPYSYGPYNDKNAYVYDSLYRASLATQAMLKRLDQSAEDYVQSLYLPPSTDDGYKLLSGFVNRIDSTMSINAGIFSIAPTTTSYDVFTEGVLHTIITTQTVSITDDQTITYVYIDTDGILKKSTAIWDIEGGVAPTAIIFKDGSNYAITDERHGYDRNKPWHKWAHFNIGCMYRSGLTGSFTDTTFSVTQGKIADEDIDYDTGGTKTTCTLWYRNATTGMRIIRNSTTPFYTTGGALKYDDGSGTLASVTNNKYINSWVYASADNTEPIYVVIGQNQYTTLADSNNATRPTINLSTAEWKLIYKVTFRCVSGVASYISATDYRTVQTGVPTSATTTDHASLINRDAVNSHPASAISYDDGTDTLSDVQTELDDIIDGTTDLTMYALLAGRSGDVLLMDTITEKTPENGVDIEGVKLKDSEIEFQYLDKYTNSTPMPEDVGGAEAGTTFNEQRIDQVLTTILYPYQVPSFLTFAISGQTTPLEVGESIAANRTFTWTTSPLGDGNINTNSLVIRDVTGSTDIATGLANDGSQATTYGAITKTTATTNQFSITGTNSKSETFTKTYTVTWYWRIYYGTSASTTLDELGVEGLTSKPLASGYAATYAFTAGNYKYICYPTAFGTATTFKDTSTGLNVPMETVYTVAVTNTGGVTTNYNVHRSTNILGSAISIIVSA